MVDCSNHACDELKGNSAKFNRLLLASLLFALVGHFTIVRPHYRHEERKAGIEAQLPSLESSADLCKRIARVGAGLSNIERRIVHLPTDLNASLLTTPRESSEPPSQKGTQTDSSRADTARRQRQFVLKWEMDLLHDLDQKVVCPAADIDSTLGGVRVGSSALAELADKGQDLFVNSTSLTALRSTADVKSEAKNLQGNLNESFGGDFRKALCHAAELASWPQKVESTGALLSTLSGSAVILNDTLAKSKQRLENERKSLQRQTTVFQSLEDRVGRLPFDLSDLIVLFPVLVLTLLGMLTALAIRVRRTRAALCVKCGHGAQCLDRDLLDLCTDCWLLPPYRTITSRLLALMTAGIFLYVSVDGGQLALRCIWKQTVPARENEVFSSPVSIYALYSVAAASSFFCLYWLWQVYRKEEPALHPPDRIAAMMSLWSRSAMSRVRTLSAEARGRCARSPLTSFLLHIMRVRKRP